MAEKTENEDKERKAIEAAMARGIEITPDEMMREIKVAFGPGSLEMGKLIIWSMAANLVGMESSKRMDVAKKTIREAQIILSRENEPGADEYANLFATIVCKAAEEFDKTGVKDFWLLR